MLTFDSNRWFELKIWFHQVIQVPDLGRAVERATVKNIRLWIVVKVKRTHFGWKWKGTH